MGDKVITYGQKGYYLSVKGLLLTDNALICIMTFSYYRCF